jgi:hypothetical protein
MTLDKFLALVIQHTGAYCVFVTVLMILSLEIGIALGTVLVFIL